MFETNFHPFFLKKFPFIEVIIILIYMPNKRRKKVLKDDTSKFIIIINYLYSFDIKHWYFFLDNVDSQVINDLTETRRQKIRERRKKYREVKKILNDKLVKVVPLNDETNLFSEKTTLKSTTKEAELFLKEHFWGTRIERLKSDGNLNERKTGPAIPFVVQK